MLEEIQDRKDLLGPYIPALQDETYHCLRFIDRHGDAYFNRFQMDTFKSEWERLSGSVEETDKDTEVAVKRLFERVRELIAKCQEEPHLYLKFQGD